MRLKELKEYAKSALAKLFAAGIELTPEEVEGLKAFCRAGGLLVNVDASELQLLEEVSEGGQLLAALGELAAISVERRFAIVYGE